MAIFSTYCLATAKYPLGYKYLWLGISEVKKHSLLSGSPMWGFGAFLCFYMIVNWICLKLDCWLRDKTRLQQHYSLRKEEKPHISGFYNPAQCQHSSGRSVVSLEALTAEVLLDEASKGLWETRWNSWHCVDCCAGQTLPCWTCWRHTTSRARDWKQGNKGLLHELVQVWQRKRWIRDKKTVNRNGGSETGCLEYVGVHVSWVLWVHIWVQTTHLFMNERIERGWTTLENYMQCYFGVQVSYLTQDHIINAVTAVATADPSEL